MTRQETAKLKAEFVRDRQEAMMRVVGSAEKQLLNAIFDSLFEELGKSEGQIVSDSGRSMKLSAAVEKVFQHFQKNKNVDIIRGIVGDLQQIGDLNKKYFSLFRVRAQRLSAIVNEVERTMTERIGIDENGKILRGGYLDNLLTDTTVRNAVQREVRQAAVNGLTIKDMFNNVKHVVVGDATKAGGLSSQYRTFVHDTFAQYDNGFADGVAKKIGLNAAIYAGGVIATSRDFCRHYNGQVLTRKEIEGLKKSPLLLKTKQEKKSGVVNYNPLTDMGRWNCRHNWNWITNEEAIRLRPELAGQL